MFEAACSLKTLFSLALTLGILLQPLGIVTSIRGQDGPVMLASLDFDPQRDGFGFPNYPTDENPHDGSEDLSAVDLIRMFGTAAVCKNANATVANCVIKASAREWMENELESMNKGHCEGMAVTCLRLNKQMPFKGKRAASDFKAGVRKPFDLELDPIVANYIAYYWATQSLPEVADIGQSWSKKGPLAIVNELIRSMKAGDETYTFGICKRNGSECDDGHAITPFAVEDAGNQYKVHVYDNNDSGETKILTVDKGGRNTWKYTAAINPDANPDVYTGDRSSESLEIVPTSKREGQCFTAPFDESDTLATGCGIEAVKPGTAKPSPTPTKPGPKPAATPAKAKGRYADFFLTGDGEMLILDDKERRLGYDPDADAYFNEIPGAKRTVNVGGKGIDMPHFNIPFANGDKVYTVVFSGDNLKKQSVMDFVFTGPGFSIGLDGIQLDPGEFMAAAFSSDGERIALEMSKDGQLPEIFYSVDTAKKSYIAEIRPVRSTPFDKAPGKPTRKKDKPAPSIFLDFTDSDNIEISDNIDGDDGYDIDIEQFDASGKSNVLSLNNVGTGDTGADSYRIELGKWDGSGKIGVKHDDEGNGFADDEEETEENEPNDIPDDDEGDLIRFIYASLN